MSNGQRGPKDNEQQVSDGQRSPKGSEQGTLCAGEP